MGASCSGLCGELSVNSTPRRADGKPRVQCRNRGRGLVGFCRKVDNNSLLSTISGIFSLKRFNIWYRS